MKELLNEAEVPTALYVVFTELEPAVRFLRTLPGPWVVKTDGLAAGKGVLVTGSFAEAVADLRDKLSGSSFAGAGRPVVIEEGLTGPEPSVFALCDGHPAVALTPARTTSASATGTPGRTPEAWERSRRCPTSRRPGRQGRPLDGARPWPRCPRGASTTVGRSTPG